VAEFQNADNAKKLQFAKQETKGDIGFFFVRVIPVATEIVGPIIQKYGFSASEQGALEFLEAIGQHQDDLSIKESLQFLNSQFMPNNDSKGT